jgi:hypothetical protein
MMQLLKQKETLPARKASRPEAKITKNFLFLAARTSF